MDLNTLMRRAASFYSEREAVVHGERRLTFAEAWARGLRMANALIDLDLRPGDRVGVLEDNSIEAQDIFAGAVAANVVRVPLYPRNGREAHLHMLGHTNCRVLFVAENYADEVEGMVDELPDLERIVVRGADYEDWLSRYPATDPEVPVAEDDYFIIRHTGGTTGQSKGVGISHRSWLATGRDWFYLCPPVEPGDKCLHLGPISHASGYLYVPIWLGGGCSVMLDHFDVRHTIEVMEGEGIAYMFMVPTMLNAINQDETVRGRDWSKLKCLQLAASPVSDDTALTAHEIFGDALYQLYGQTECLPVAMMGPRQWFAEVEGSTPLRACGIALPFSELEIRDEENRPLSYGEVGEICAKADGQMEGFWNNPEATAERLVDGWVKTGDIGYLDRNGYLYMVDRADDMIISGGYNIWPMELENVISDLGDVIEVAVFGIPHEKWGETPHAVCVVREGAAVTEDEIIQLCAERLGSYKKPAGVSFQTEPLPKSPVGKVKRKDLREPYWAGRERRISGS